MQEGGSATQVAEDEERLFDGMIFISREENIIQPETKPVDEHADGPDNTEERKENKAFSGKAGGCIF